MTTLLERFVKYARIDTQSDETSPTAPSTAKQLDLCRLLADECRELGLQDVSLSEHGVVMATLPATVSHVAPTIAWFAHVDTSSEFCGTGVKPVVHENYDGQDIVLPGDPAKVIRVDENPTLRELVGGTVVTTDGTTLLGADDKSGIAVIMSAVEHLLQHPELAHGPIRVCFTCDEEIGRGVDHIDVDQINAVCGYTLDSEGSGRIDSETFSADQAIVTVEGINTHPSIGYGKMVNAVRMLSQFISRLPTDTLSPETTRDREGFLHPYHIEGGVARCQTRIILRDFETENLQQQKRLLERIAEELQAAEPRARITVETRPQYRNMRDGLQREPRAIAKAEAAIRAAGLEPIHEIIRGGTDGSLLTAKGLPTPNISAGQHNPHSPLEWTSLEEMQQAVEVLVQLAIAWGGETVE